jgi:hypothetical protein
VTTNRAVLAWLVLRVWRQPVPAQVLVSAPLAAVVPRQVVQQQLVPRPQVRRVLARLLRQLVLRLRLQRLWLLAFVSASPWALARL